MTGRVQNRVSMNWSLQTGFRTTRQERERDREPAWFADSSKHQVRFEKLYPDRKQHNPKDFSKHRQTTAAQLFFDPTAGLQNQEDHDQVDQNRDENRPLWKFGFKRQNGCQCSSSGDQWESKWNDRGRIRSFIWILFEDVNPQHHLQTEQENHDAPSDGKRADIGAKQMQDRVADKQKTDHQHPRRDGCLEHLQSTDPIFDVNNDRQGSENVDYGKQNQRN